MNKKQKIKKDRRELQRYEQRLRNRREEIGRQAEAYSLTGRKQRIAAIGESVLKLLEDLHKRTGLTITKVKVGSVDFLKDSAILKVEYETDGVPTSHVNNTLKVPRYEWEEVKENG